MEQFLLAICGVPSSGKTTLARIIREHMESLVKVEVVSTDRWRDEEFYSDFKPEKEHRVRKEALEKTRSLVMQGVSVIHDDTNYYTSMRHELYDIARQNQTVFAVVHVSTPVKVAVQWNMVRERPVPEGVIEKIGERFDRPGSKYAWDRPIATHNLDRVSPVDAASEIVERIGSLGPISSEGRSHEEASSDLLDVITRQVVRQFLADNPDMRKDPRVSDMRRGFLTQAKEKELSPLEVETQLRVRLNELKAQASRGKNDK